MLVDKKGVIQREAPFKASGALMRLNDQYSSEHEYSIFIILFTSILQALEQKLRTKLPKKNNNFLTEVLFVTVTVVTKQ